MNILKRRCNIGSKGSFHNDRSHSKRLPVISSHNHELFIEIWSNNHLVRCAKELSLRQYSSFRSIVTTFQLKQSCWINPCTRYCHIPCVILLQCLTADGLYHKWELKYTYMHYVHILRLLINLDNIKPHIGLDNFLPSTLCMYNTITYTSSNLWHRHQELPTQVYCDLNAWLLYQSKNVSFNGDGCDEEDDSDEDECDEINDSAIDVGPWVALLAGRLIMPSRNYTQYTE